MKKFINEPEQIAEDMIASFLSIHHRRLKKLTGLSVVARRDIEADKVGIVIGNGLGHEPACIGFVGKNALDCNAYGNLFSAPGPKHILGAILEADQGRGVIVLTSNHAGDVLNSGIAVRWAREDGIDARMVLLYDDVLSAPKHLIHERRGTAGTFFNYRLAGAYAGEGHDIAAVERFASRVNERTRTVTIASVPGTSPLSGEPMGSIRADEYEIGIGVHGEAAASVLKVQPVSKIAARMADYLLTDGDYQGAEEIIVLVNGCGQTTNMELLIFYGEVERYLQEKGISIYRPAIGSFITTQEMGGIALSFLKADDEMKRLWSRPTDAPGFMGIGGNLV